MAFLPALTSILAFLFALMLIDQCRERRQGFQLVWALGMLWYGIGSGSEALAAAGGWNETLYRAWYLTGAVWTAGWLGLGTAYLLGRTRFGYSFALCLFLAGLFTFLVRNRPEYQGAGTLPAAIWRNFMLAATQGMPARPLPSGPALADAGEGSALDRLFGWLTGGPWKGRKAIGCSLATDHRGEILAEGPYGESAETLIVVDVVLRQPRVTGTQIADDLLARGYLGP